MGNNLWFFRAFKTLGPVLAVVLSTNVCASFLGFGGTSWKEEVLLHDGSKIIVEHTMKRGGRHELGQPSTVGEERLVFKMPRTGQEVTWTSEYSKDVGYVNFSPLVLDIFDGVAYLVASPDGCLAYNKWGRPNPPYVIFKYENDAWKRIPLSALPAEVKTPNLIVNSPDTEAKKMGYGLITAETIRKLNSEEVFTPELRTILRKEVPYGGQGKECGELVHTNEGWEGLGFFSSQHSYETCLSYCERKSVASQECPCARLFKGK